jgi:hypothetical protein
MSIDLTPLERRLVAALDARAAQVTIDDLRTPAPLTGSMPARRWLMTVVGMAAALVAVACFVALAQTPDRQGKTRPLAPRVPPSDVVTGAPAASPLPSHTAAPRISRGAGPPAAVLSSQDAGAPGRPTSVRPGVHPSKLVPPASATSPTESPQDPVLEPSASVSATP